MHNKNAPFHLPSLQQNAPFNLPSFRPNIHFYLPSFRANVHFYLPSFQPIVHFYLPSFQPIVHFYLHSLQHNVPFNLPPAQWNDSNKAMTFGKNCQLSSNSLFQNAISPFRPMLVKNCQMFSAKKFVIKAILFYFCSRQISDKRARLTNEIFFNETKSEEIWMPSTLLAVWSHLHILSIWSFFISALG